MMMNRPSSTSAAEGRYFIAIIPPPEIALALTAHKEFCADNFNAKASLRSPVHITLAMPFLWKLKKEQKLVDILADFCLTQQKFNVRLNGFNAFIPRVIYASVEQNENLINFQKNLSRELRIKANLFHTNRYDLPYHPHVTIAFRDLKKEVFDQAFNHFKGLPCSYQWLVSEVSLLKQENKIWYAYRNIAL